jgi:hypothetical protein
MGHTQELEYAKLPTDTLITLQRIFAQWPLRGGIGVARVRLSVVERVLADRGVTWDVPAAELPVVERS